MTRTLLKPPRHRVGIALGSGSARGLAHIGVLQALSELDIEPDIVCGSSIGALVGASFVAGKLDDLASWASALSTSDVLRFMGIRLMAQGGMAEAGRLIAHLRDICGDHLIEDLPKPFAAVATDIHLGREVWLQHGPLWDAVRASIAIPGLLTPWLHNNDWLVDGALVNPVPVSLCKALGADIIIAVNLNTVRRQPPSPGLQDTEPEPDASTLPEPAEVSAGLLGRLTSSVRGATDGVRRRWREGSAVAAPGTLNVMLNSINIMQDRITRSRLAGEPPDVMLTPRLADIGLLEFNRATETIAEGRACVMRAADTLRHALDM
ncbi:MAG: patatin-like phospholipase family protein [Spongiibacteraceae bacterium]